MKQNTMPEFVGTTVLDTIGLVIASVDPELRKKMKIKENYRSVGIISSRTGAAGQITRYSSLKDSDGVISLSR